jgi:hypothetical protein
MPVRKTHIDIIKEKVGAEDGSEDDFAGRNKRNLRKTELN